MKIKFKIIISSVIFGLLVCLIDVVLDYFIFYEGAFWGLLIFDVPAHEIYIRTLILGCFTIFGILMASVMAEREQVEKRLLRVNRSLKMLSECNQKLVHATNESELLHNICRDIVEVGGYRLAWVGFAEQNDEKTVSPAAQTGYEQGYLETLNLTWADTERGHGPTGTAIRTGKPCIAENILTGPNFAPWREAAIQRGYASSVALPMMANEQVLGALNIYSAEPDAFSDSQELKLAVELADDLAYGIQALRTKKKHAQAEKSLKIQTHDLGERVKELNCLYGISHLVEEPGITLEGILQRTVDLIPSGWQYPEITCVRIIFKAQELKTQNFIETIWKLAAKLVVHGKPAGMLEVYYQEERPEIDEGPFLKEERNLIDAITECLGRIIERKQAKDSLQKTCDELEFRVKERTAELVTANEELSKADRLKDEFLANMSHELRTPLNGILGYAQILKRGDLTARQKEGVDIIQNSGEHLLMLINEILNLSKIEAGRMELEQNEFHPADFLKTIADMIHIRAEQKGITFTYEPSADLPVGVRGDKKKLSQILINLLGNAVKFTEKGGITFRIWNLGLQTPPNRLIRFEIEDTGIGIFHENLEEMFLPFRQVGDRRHASEGTGLGLAISNKLVQMMGGKLNVKSELGKGSVFRFDLDLPEVADFVPPQEDTKVIIGYQGKKRKILVVDDIWENCMVMTNILQPLGFDILEAKDGLDCLEKARIFEPDVILLDMRMPVMNGFEATRQSRQIDSLKNVVIIAVTASAFEDDREKCLAAGCNDFIAKPINATELLELLRNHLNLEWIHEKKPDILQTDDAQLLSMTLPPEHIDILCKLAARRSVKKLLQHLTKIEESDNKLLPLTGKIRRLARQLQLSELIAYLKQRS